MLIVVATATAAAHSGIGMKRAAVTPINAARKFPPITDHGCANGLAGTPNTNTVEAPIGAISNGTSSFEPAHARDTAPVKSSPISAPTHAATRSQPGKGVLTGLNRANQLRASAVNMGARDVSIIDTIFKEIGG